MLKYDKRVIEIRDVDESKKVQEFLFKLGYKWPSGGKKVQHLYANYIYLYEEGLIRFSDDLDGGFEMITVKELFNIVPEELFVL